MTVRLQKYSIDRLRDALCVLVVDRRYASTEAFAAIDRGCRGAVSREAKRRRFRTGSGRHLAVQTHCDAPGPVVLLVSAGAQDGTATWLRAAQCIVDTARGHGLAKAAVILPDETPEQAVRNLCEGMAMAQYRFAAATKSGTARAKDRRPVSASLLVGAPSAEQRDLCRRAGIAADAVEMARQLIDTPAAELPPLELGARAAALAGGDLAVEVHGPTALEKLGMGAILAVGRGSRQPPCLIEMRYSPAGESAPHIALVGKGITFDSGGLSIKPAGSMEQMKRDMGGGAVVLAASVAAARLALPIGLRTYIAAAENMPDGDAIRPGDVIRSHSGTTIEVLNTDAEGRLVLADALSYAAAAKPTAMIDFATLTGAVRVALGKRCAAVMGTEPGLVDRLVESASACAEHLWPLPLLDEYRSDLDSRIADIKNMGAGHAGTIVAGLFLKEFTDGIPWAHIDMSSTVLSDGYACHPRGPSGYGVRTLVRFIEHRAEAASAARI